MAHKAYLFAAGATQRGTLHSLAVTYNYEKSIYNHHIFFNFNNELQSRQNVCFSRKWIEYKRKTIIYIK